MSIYPNTKPTIINNNSFGLHYYEPNVYYHISRYGNTLLIQDKIYNEKYHATVSNYTVVESENDQYITIDKDTRLDIIANEYYGDSSLWWVVGLANNIMDGIDTVKKGTLLRIPPILNIYKRGSILGD